MYRNICHLSCIQQLHEPIFDPVVTASSKTRTADRVVVRVKILSAFTWLPIVRSLNPQSAFYPWPVVKRYDTNCSYVCRHLLIRHRRRCRISTNYRKQIAKQANTTQLTKSAALTDGSSSLWSFVNLNPLFSMRNDTEQKFPTTQRPRPLCLLVISNGGQEVHTRTPEKKRHCRKLQIHWINQTINSQSTIL